MASRSAAGEGRRAGTPYAQLALALLGAWSMLPPYIGPALGLELVVAADVEVVDHVVPGAVVAVCGGLAALLTRRGRGGGPGEPGLALLTLGGLCFLAGLWQVATHVPLVADAGDPGAAWGPVLLHSTPGVPIVALALWLTLRDSGEQNTAH